MNINFAPIIYIDHTGPHPRRSRRAFRPSKFAPSNGDIVFILFWEGLFCRITIKISFYHVHPNLKILPISQHYLLEFKVSRDRT